MKNNYGFSNILVISIVLILLGVGGYFGFKYFQNKDNKPAPIKKEITKFKPTISDKDTYFEVIDSNSSKKVSIKLPKNVNLDTTYRYNKEVKADTKKITKKEFYTFVNTSVVGEEKGIYGLDFVVSKVVPQLDFYPEVCDGSGIEISTNNKNANSVMDYYKNEISSYKNPPLIKESTVNNFKVYTIDPLARLGNFIVTIFDIDENYSLQISRGYCESSEDKNNDVMSNVYNQVINSVSEIK